MATTTTTLADGTQVTERVITKTDTYYTIRQFLSGRDNPDSAVASYGRYDTKEEATGSLSEAEKADENYVVTLVTSTYQTIDRTSYTEV